MAYPQSRSMNANLSEGMTDGKYKKVRMNTGNITFDDTYLSRRDLDDRYYGIHEKKDMVAPDELVHPHADFVPTPPPNRETW